MPSWRRTFPSWPRGPTNTTCPTSSTPWWSWGSAATTPTWSTVSGDVGRPFQLAYRVPMRHSCEFWAFYQVLNWGSKRSVDLSQWSGQWVHRALFWTSSLPIRRQMMNLTAVLCGPAIWPTLPTWDQGDVLLRWKSDHGAVRLKLCR